MSAAADRHNALAPAILRQIVGQCQTEAEALVVVESVLAGVAYYYSVKSSVPPVARRRAGEMVDHVAAAAIERIATL